MHYGPNPTQTFHISYPRENTGRYLAGGMSPAECHASALCPRPMRPHPVRPQHRRMTTRDPGELETCIHQFFGHSACITDRNHYSHYVYPIPQVASMRIRAYRRAYVGANDLPRVKYDSLTIYRGTSLIRNCNSLGPYSRPIPRALRRSWGGGRFLIREVPMHSRASLFASVRKTAEGAGRNKGGGFRTEIERARAEERCRHSMKGAIHTMVAAWLV